MTQSNPIFLALKWSAIGKLTGQFISWAITLYVMRILTPEDYGLLAIASIFTSLLLMLGEAGMQAAIIRSETVETEHLRRLFGVVCAGHTLVTLLLIIAAPVVAFVYDDIRIMHIMIVLAINAFILMFQCVPLALLLREMNFKTQAGIALVKVIVQGGSTLILALNDFGVWSLVFGELISTIVAIFCFNIAKPFLHMPKFEFSEVLPELSFGGYILLQRLLWWVNQSFDRLLLGLLLGPIQLGYYAVGNQIASLPKDKLGQILNQITFSAVAKMRHDPKHLKHSLLKALEIMGFLLFPVFAGLSLISENIINIILTDKWSNALIPIALLSLSMPFRMLSIPMSEAVNAIGSPKIILKSQVIGVINVVGTISIGAIWGLLGVCLAWLCVAPLNIIILLWLSKPHTNIKIRDFWRAISGPFATTVLMYLSVMLFKYLLPALTIQFPFIYIGETSKMIYIQDTIMVILIGITSYALISLIVARRSIQHAKSLFLGFRNN